MGRTEKRELISRRAVLLLHLPKWRCQPDKRGASWEASIRVKRNRVADHLDDNPSLKPLLPQALTLAYRDAALEAIAETGLPEPRFRGVARGRSSRLWTRGFGRGEAIDRRTRHRPLFSFRNSAGGRDRQSVPAASAATPAVPSFSRSRMGSRSLRNA
jgi:hypothetical protein